MRGNGSSEPSEQGNLLLTYEEKKALKICKRLLAGCFERTETPYWK